LLGIAVLLSIATPASGSSAVSRTSASMAAGSGLESAALLAVGPYRLRFYHSLKCADNPNYSTANVWLDQWTCVSQTNEQWYFDFVEYDRGYYWYEIRNRASGKCMNVEQASQLNSAHVIQYSCAGSYHNAQWALARTSTLPSGYYWLFPRHSDKCLNVAGGSTAVGAKLIQYTCGFYTNEYVALIT
jgi:hypothetical protein